MTTLLDRAVRKFVVVRSNQQVFNDVVEAYLNRLDFDEDGYARLIRLPGSRVAQVVVDPARGFEQPIFVRGGARVEDARSLFRSDPHSVLELRKRDAILAGDDVEGLTGTVTV